MKLVSETGISPPANDAELPDIPGDLLGGRDTPEGAAERSPLDRRPQVSMANLALVNIPAPSRKPGHDLLPPWKGMDAFFRPETCARHLIVCGKSQLDTLPPRVFELAREVVTDKQAYLYLLELATGLRSQIIGEYHVTGDLKKSWAEYSKSQGEHTASSPSLSRIMQSAIEDTRSVRSNFLDQLKPASPEYAAKQLAKIKGGESVTIVVDGTDETTDSIARAVAHTLGRSSSTPVREIFLAHPDPDLLQDLWKNFQGRRGEKKMVCDVVACPWECLPEAAKLSDHLFQCGRLSGAERPTNFEEALINAWNDRQRSSGHLVLLGGNPNQFIPLQSYWTELKDVGLIDPNQIREKALENRIYRDKMVPAASIACANLAEMRIQGLGNKRDRTAALTLAPEDFADFVAMTKSVPRERIA